MSHMPRRESLGAFPSCMGGYTTETDGYIYEFAPTHPACNGWGYVQQHRLVAEAALGRLLRRDEVVHHRDGNPHNNTPENLQAVTRAEHRAIHAEAWLATVRSPITEESVRAALQGRTLKQAAAHLHVHTQTLRNRFPELVAPYQRKSPTKIDDATVIAVVRELAADPQRGYREIAHAYGISFSTVRRICAHEGIEWTKKTKRGEVHRHYRRKTPTPVG